VCVDKTLPQPTPTGLRDTRSGSAFYSDLSWLIKQLALGQAFKRFLHQLLNNGLAYDILRYRT
jgi:hypothetical protein